MGVDIQMASATCRSCGVENTNHARFCKACGESLAAPVSDSNCPACQATNKPDAKFCKQCGHCFIKKEAPSQINIDDVALVNEAVKSSTSFPHRVAPTSVQPQSVGQFPLKWLAVGSVVLMLMAASWWWLQGARKPDDSSIGQPAQPTVQSSAAAAPAETLQPTAAPSPAAAATSAVTPASGQQNTPNAARAVASPPVSSTKTDNGTLSAQQTTPTRQPNVEKRPRQAAPETARTPTMSGYSSVESAYTRTQQVPRAAPQPLPPQVTTVTSAPTANNPASPSDACGKRVLLALATCIQRECETSRFAQHPQCVQLRERRQGEERDSLYVN